MRDSVACTVRLFGPACALAGASEMTLQLPSPATAGQAVRALAEACPELAPLLPRSRVAVNLVYVDAARELAPGDEIAILPPVGGG